MAQFKDLTEYTYLKEVCRPNTLNIGWLGSGHRFRKFVPSEDLADRLWEYCQVSVGQTRGFHVCEICASGPSWGYRVMAKIAASVGIVMQMQVKKPQEFALPLQASRHGVKLELGSAEIRVFGDGGKIYAAPNLIYHYMIHHGYHPPREFFRALKNGPSPDNPEYFARLAELRLQWGRTFSG